MTDSLITWSLQTGDSVVATAHPNLLGVTYSNATGTGQLSIGGVIPNPPFSQARFTSDGGLDILSMNSSNLLTSPPAGLSAFGNEQQSGVTRAFGGPAIKEVSAVPLPSSLPIFGLVLGGLMFWTSRKSCKRTHA